MSDLISRSALIEAIKGVEVAWYLDGNYSTYDDTSIMEIIDEQPTVEAKPVVHGEWIKQKECIDTWKCTNCGEVEKVPTCMGEPMYNFCPNCGCDMRGGKHD